jgi:hypothetical protein
MSLERRQPAYDLAMSRRLGLLLVMALVPLTLVPSGADAAGASGHDVAIAGTGVEVYPAYADDIKQYAIRTTDSTGDLTVTVRGVQPDATVEVDGRPAAADEPVTLSGLEPGDRIQVYIDDDCCRPSRQTWIYLPPGFPRITTEGPATGDPVFVGLASFLSATSYATVLDRRGVPLWVREAPEPNDLRAQPSGPAYSMFEPVKDSPSDTEYGYRLLEMNSRFQVVGTRRLAPVPRLGVTPDDTDFHDVQFLPDGRVVLVGYHRDFRDDGTPWLDAIIQIQRADGTPTFTWTSKGHVDPSEGHVFGAKGQDYAHLNSVEHEPNGDLVASFRNTGQVLRIATRKHDGFRRGQVIWRLGGDRSDFTFVDDPFGGFCAQHDARILPNGHLSVFDNGSRKETTGPVAPQTADMCPDPGGAGTRVARPQTRVAEYALDTDAMTATLVSSYVPTGRYTAFAGNAQRLASGNTFVGWAHASQPDGVAPFASEVTPAGDEVWSARAQGWFSYRALTAPVVPRRDVQAGLTRGGPPPYPARVRVRVGKAEKTVYVVVTNSGEARDRFGLRWSPDGRFTVSLSGHPRTPVLRPGESAWVPLVVSRGRAPSGTERAIRINARSAAEPSSTDTVRLRLVAR